MKLQKVIFILSVILSINLASCHYDFYNFSSSNKDFMFTHKVAKGENVHLIAKKYQTTAAEIISINDLDPPYIIFVGQKLYIPKTAKVHIVRAGETIGIIAKKHQTSFKKLAQYNSLKHPYTIYPGQKIFLFHKPKNIDNKLDATSYVSATKTALRSPPPRSGKFQWPAKGKVINPYGKIGLGKKNDGINIALKNGTPIRAADDGIVAYSGSELKSFGNLVLIKHTGGWLTTYGHNKRIIVKRGDSVRKGQIIAYAGQSGSVTRPQLYFQIRKKKQTLNPLKYLP